MRTRIPVLAAMLFAAACTDSHDSFAASQGNRIRVAGLGDLVRPRFATGGGSFLTFEGPDAIGNLAVFHFLTGQLLTELASVPQPGGEDFANDDSFDGTPTAGGELAAFVSRASNLPGLEGMTTFERSHAWVRNLVTGENDLISRNQDGFEANRDTVGATISANGRFVVFASRATNLLPTATNGAAQLYLWDRTIGRLELLTFRPDGFAADGDSFQPVITGDGRFVAFLSDATDLVAGDGNGASDVFLFDRSTRTFDRVSAGFAISDRDTPAVSQNGNIVAFSGPLSVFVRDRAAGDTSNVGAGRAPALSPDGRFLAFESEDGPGPQTDVFVLDLTTEDEPTLVSIALDGGPADGDSVSPTISADGLWIAFSTTATNLVELREDEEETVFADILLLPNPLG
jgi:Tol biopolymer transport system component